MRKLQDAIGATLIEVARTIESLTDEQVQDWLDGNLRVVVTLETTGTAKRARKAGDVRQPLDLQLLRNQLAQVETVEQARDIIVNANLTKASLQQLAKCLDLPSPRTDTVERLQDRIVDATVGYRVRSRAIQEGHLGLTLRESDQAQKRDHNADRSNVEMPTELDRMERGLPFERK